MKQLLDIEGSAFAGSFGRSPCAVTHGLEGHPLLTVDAIADLAEALPEHSVEHNVGNLPVVLADGEAPVLRLPPGDVARGIETNGCWMVLKNIEAHPDYARLLDACLNEVEARLGDAEGGMGVREGFIFLSSGGSVTPAHFDPEHNLLLQVRGDKTMNVGRFPDARLEQRELERYYLRAGRNVAWTPAEARAVRMGPGDGVYVPVHAPHWVTVSEDVSVSLSITFRTHATDAAADLHRVNARLRALRLSPPPVGARPRADRLKVAAGRLEVAVGRVARSALSRLRRRRQPDR